MKPLGWPTTSVYSDSGLLANEGKKRYGAQVLNDYITPEIQNFVGAKIVTVGLISGDLILTGRRRDNNRYVSPGGHVDAGEEFRAAACREVREEAGIELLESDLDFICAKKLMSHRSRKEFVVVAYCARIAKERATPKYDPDKEVFSWEWVKIDPSTPELQPEARHAKDDFILNYLFKRGY